MPKLRAPKWKPVKGGAEKPYEPWPQEISVLRDIPKAMAYYERIYSQGLMDYKSFRAHQHALQAIRQALQIATMIEIKHGAVENQARKPIMVIEERSFPPSVRGTPPKRPTSGSGGPLRPQAAPNGGHSADAAPRPPKVVH